MRILHLMAAAIVIATGTAFIADGNAMERTARNVASENVQSMDMRLESSNAALAATINALNERVKALEDRKTGTATIVSGGSVSSNGAGSRYTGWVTADMCFLTGAYYAFGSATAGCVIEQSGGSWRLSAYSNSSACSAWKLCGAFSTLRGRPPAFNGTTRDGSPAIRG